MKPLAAKIVAACMHMLMYSWNVLEMLYTAFLKSNMNCQDACPIYLLKMAEIELLRTSLLSRSQLFYSVYRIKLTCTQSSNSL